MELALTALATSIAGAGLLVVYLRRHSERPLATAANILDALRHGDYMQRARTDVVQGSVRQLLEEVNELARHLEAERQRREETVALLEAVARKIDVALLTFDQEQRLTWWNHAATELLSKKLRPLLSAEELGLEQLLRGPTPRSISLAAPLRAVASTNTASSTANEPPTGTSAATGPASTASAGNTRQVLELRRGTFLRQGKRYFFVLLASAQRVRREQEQQAWSSLIRVLGHEVNNTLAPIQSMAATCQEIVAEAPRPGDEQLQMALQAMEQRAASLSAFIDEFRRVGRLPQPQPQAHALLESMQNISALDTRCPVHIQLSASLEARIDKPLFEQALSNLLRNAVDAASSTGGQVFVKGWGDSSHTWITIEDEGAGIANPANLFVPLFSTKPGGSGIGLLVARNIVEAHGGELQLSNRPKGTGCIASIRLPRP